MLYNLLITGLRYLKRNPLYAFINLIGLGIGMAAAILIITYVVYESSYDKAHRDGDRVVRLVQGDWGLHSPSLKYDLDELVFIEKTARVDVMFGNRMAVRYNDKLLNINDIIFTDQELPGILHFDFIAGKPETALAEPFSMVLTQTTAKNIFGDDDAVGKVIRVDNRFNFTITAIIADISHAHLGFNGMAMFEDLPAISGQPDILQRTGYWNFHYYLRLADGISHEQAAEAINQYLADRQNWTDGSTPHYRFQTIDEVYFDRSVVHESGIQHGNRIMVQVFLFVALIIVLLAVINFINITTANATNRAKETGVRKVVGSSRSALIGQYTAEAVFLSFIAMLLAVLLVELTMPYLRLMLQKDLVINFMHPAIIAALVGGALITGLITGLLPAWMLSSFKPVDVLKGFSDRQGSKGNIRSILSVTQFTISICLISTTLIVYQQVKFIQSKSLGINIENLVYAKVSPDINNSKTAFSEALLQHTGITEVAYTNAIPGHIRWQEAFNIDGRSQQYTFLVTTPGFLDLIGLEVAEGRKFTNSIADEGQSIIVNRAAVAHFGWDEPLGHTEQTPFKGPMTVIGVTDNFHYNDVTQAVGPLVIGLNERASQVVCLRIDPDQKELALSFFEETWTAFSPDFPFEYGFVRDAFSGFYKEQEVQLKVFIAFASLSVLIAVLGLYGMAAFTANRKRKEVCIRKIHGAGIGSLYIFLSYNMLKLVVLAMIIATPLSWIIADNWLNRFPYQIGIDWWIFSLASLISIAISQLTITGQLLRVSRVNPAEALRYE